MTYPELSTVYDEFEVEVEMSSWVTLDKTLHVKFAYRFLEFITTKVFKWFKTKHYLGILFGFEKVEVVVSFEG